MQRFDTVCYLLRISGVAIAVSAGMNEKFSNELCFDEVAVCRFAADICKLTLVT